MEEKKKDITEKKTKEKDSTPSFVEEMGVDEIETRARKNAPEED